MIADDPGLSDSPICLSRASEKPPSRDLGGQAADHCAAQRRPAHRAGQQTDHAAHHTTDHRALAAAHVAGLFDAQFAVGILHQDRRIFDLDQALLLGLFELCQRRAGAIRILERRDDDLNRYV